MQDAANWEEGFNSIQTQSNPTRSNADDVLRLLRELKVFPNMLIGHSYGVSVWP